MPKRLISYALYGSMPFYWRGALDNVRYARYFYPGWTCRFYVSDEIPQNLINTLKARGAEVVMMGKRINQEAMLWRFLPAAEKGLDAVIVRDTDSCFSKRETAAVQEWFQSGKKFHIMRDHPFHGIKIAGGLWGVRGPIPNLRQLITDWLARHQDQSFPKEIDQHFLAEVVYPLVVKDACIHHARPDAYSDVPNRTFKDETTLPFPTKRKSARDFVGRPRGYRKCLVALSIYRKNWLSGSRINQLIKYLNSLALPKHLTLRFYVADHLDASLYAKLQRNGQVILKTARYTYEPEYWKLLAFAEKDIDDIIVVDLAYFLSTFRVTCRQRKKRRVRTYLLYWAARLFDFNWDMRDITKVWGIGGFAPIPDVAQLIDRLESRHFSSYEAYRTSLYQIFYPKVSQYARLDPALFPWFLTRCKYSFIEFVWDKAKGLMKRLKTP